jgi:hypothetical protein
MTKRKTSAQVPWTAAERAVLNTLRTPEDIQAYLDEIPYNSADPTYRSPRQVLRDRVANCMEGAVFAAAALEHIAFPPVIVNLKAVRDDDHVLAIFRENGRVGAIAKSNYAGLRYRSPVYASIRELAMTFFDQYYNPDGELTMRGFTRPLNLATRRYLGWQTRELNLDDMSDHLDALPYVTVVDAKLEQRLRPLDERLYRSGLMGADEKGLYRAGH